MRPIFRVQANLIITLGSIETDPAKSELCYNEVTLIL